MTAPLRYLDAETLARLQNMTVRARAVIDGALSGLHRAPRFGSSVEFAEHKEYSHGDEIRHIDWKLYGKRDKYYVKRFEQESELRAYLCLDCSGSMGYAGEGRRSKLEFSSYLVASLAYLLVRQQDQAGLVVFGEQTIAHIPPRSQGRHLAELLGALESVRPEGPTNVGRALDLLLETVRRRALIMLFSDLFEDPAPLLARLRQLRARGHDVVVFQVLDPDEVDFPFDGLTIFESLEGPTTLLAEPRSLKRTYLGELKKHLEAWRRGAIESDLGYRQVSTAAALDRVLADFLQGLRGS